VRFYFDRTQSSYLARAAGEVLAFLGHTFEHSRRRYPDRDPGDIAWMGELAAERNWVVVTGDEAIRRNPAERRAWREMRLTTFFLRPAWTHTRMEEQAWRLLRWLLRLIHLVGSEVVGTGLSVPLRWHGRALQRIYSQRRLQKQNRIESHLAAWPRFGCTPGRKLSFEDRVAVKPWELWVRSEFWSRWNP
jgi:hypothetical protein